MRSTLPFGDALYFKCITFFSEIRIKNGGIAVGNFKRTAEKGHNKKDSGISHYLSYTVFIEKYAEFFTLHIFIFIYNV